MAKGEEKGRKEERRMELFFVRIGVIFDEENNIKFKGEDMMDGWMDGSIDDSK